MLTKYKEFLKLYEFHPGSEDPYTTISKKINKAITDEVNSKNNIMDIYYIPENIISFYNLGFGLRGCNSVNDFHPLHKKFNLCNLAHKEKLKSCQLKTYS